jgi:hypothetical protein
MNRFKFFLINIVAVSLLYGCGGGGGSSSSAARTFSSFSALSPPITVTLEGLSQEMAISSNGEFVTRVDGPSTATTNSSVDLKYRDDGTIERISLDTPLSSISWDETKGDVIETNALTTIADSPENNNFAVVANPTSYGWDYQTYGVWLSLDNSIINMGSISVGAPTTNASIPIAGNATFTGYHAGLYIGPTGRDTHGVDGNITANVDFTNRTVGLSSSRTTLSGGDFGPIPAPGLDFSGTLSYSPSSNKFSGNISTANGMTGTSAQELGGVYTARGPGVARLAGSYGAKK